jgi:hypothetical protein
MKAPKLRPDQIDALLGDTSPPAPAGRTPWRVVEGDTLFAVKDFDGATLFLATLGIACRSVTAVNTYAALVADAAILNKALRAVQAKLRIGPRSQSVTESIELIEMALQPEEVEPS